MTTRIPRTALSTSHDSDCRRPREALTRARISMSMRTGGTRQHSATAGRGPPPTPVASAFVPGPKRAAHGVLPVGTELLSEAIDIRRGQRLPNRPRSAALRHRQSQSVKLKGRGTPSTPCRFRFHCCGFRRGAGVGHSGGWREVEPLVHLQAEGPVRVDVGPEERGQAPPVLFVAPSGDSLVQPNGPYDDEKLEA